VNNLHSKNSSESHLMFRLVLSVLANQHLGKRL